MDKRQKTKPRKLTTLSGKVFVFFSGDCKVRTRGLMLARQASDPKVPTDSLSTLQASVVILQIATQVLGWGKEHLFHLLRTENLQKMDFSIIQRVAK
jgi:hypothetical protein